MDKPYQLTFPMYALLFKDGTGTILFRRGPDILLPLFTEDTNVQTYAAKSQLGECVAAVLPTPDDVITFLRNPPSRGHHPVTTITLDPLDNQPRQHLAWTLESFLALLNMHSREWPESGGREP